MVETTHPKITVKMVIILNFALNKPVTLSEKGRSVYKIEDKTIWLLASDG